MNYLKLLSIWIAIIAASPPSCSTLKPSRHATVDYKAIHAAATEGNLNDVKRIVNDDPSTVAAKDWEGITPLHLAVIRGHKDVCAFLLAKKADVNAKSTEGVTPLHLAAQRGNIDIIKLLIAKGALLKPRDSRGWTPQDRAEKWHKSDAAEFLKDRGG